jgi:hypothetical protein
MSNVTALFDSANSVPAKEWVGTDPDTAKALYGVAEVTKVKLETLIGSEIVIIGKLKMQGDRGPYSVYLFVPKQEELTLCTTAVSSKSFNEHVERSKLPVRGLVTKETSTKKNKEGVFNTYYILQ